MQVAERTSPPAAEQGAGARGTDGSSTGGWSCWASRSSRTCRSCSRRRAASPPTRSSTSTSIPAGCSRARRTCGTRTSGSARCRTRSSATCSRWARTSGSSTTLGDPRLGRATPLAGHDLARRRARRTVAVPHARRRAGRARIAGALVYMLTPYQLAFTARISVLLLAWAGLPWLVGLTMRAVRRGGWRDPALFALVSSPSAASTRARSLFVGIGPAALVRARRVPGPSGVSARSLRGDGARRGADARRVALVDRRAAHCRARTGSRSCSSRRRVRTVAADSDPTDLLRGHRQLVLLRPRPPRVLDRPGIVVRDTTSRRMVASFAVPVVALALGRDHAVAPPRLLRAAAWSWARSSSSARGRTTTRARTARCSSASPTTPPPASRCATRRARCRCSCSASPAWSPRASPRSRPAATWSSAPRCRRWWWACSRSAAFVAGVAATATSRSTSTGPKTFPQYWKDAVAATAPRRATRPAILEIPGSDFAAYRWGDTDRADHPRAHRPPVRRARDAAVGHRPPSVNLLVALDHRLQDGTFEPDALAAYRAARRASAPSCCAPTSQYERFDTPRPASSGSCSPNRCPSGLDDPVGFGPRTPNPRHATGAGDRRPRARARPRRRGQPAAGRAVRRDGRGADRARRADRRNRCCSRVTARASSTPRLPGSSTAGAGARDRRARREAVAHAARRRRRPRAHRLEPAPQPAVLRRHPRQQRVHRARGPGLLAATSSGSTRSRSRATTTRTVVEQHGGTVDATGYATPTRPAGEGGRRRPADLAGSSAAPTSSGSG